MTSQRWGFHFSPHGVDESKAREIARDSYARSHTVLHSAGLANAIYDETKKAIGEEPIIILRADWPDSDWWRSPFNDPDKFVRERKHLVGSHLYLQYLNEPIATNEAQLRDLLSKCIAFMDACERHGVKGSVGGFADAATFQQNWLEAGLFDAFLERAVDWTHAGHGVINHHDYSYGCPMKNGGGQSERDMLDPARMGPETWPTAADMQKPTPGSWLDFRAQSAEEFDNEIGYQAALFLISRRGRMPQYDATRQRFIDTHGVTPEVFVQTTYVAQGAESNWTAMRYMWPQNRAVKRKGRRYLCGVGEYGPQDDLPHMRVSGLSGQIEAKFAGGRKLRGPLDQRALYSGWWPGVSTEQSHIRILRWQDGVTPEECLFIHFFAINADPEWVTFNYLLWPEFWPAFYAFAQELRRPPVSTNPPVPKPAHAGTGVQARMTAVQSYKVRSGPGTNYPQIGSVASRAVVAIYPATEQRGGSYNWIWVEGGTVPGWVADEGQFEPLTPQFGEPRTLLPVPFVDQYGADSGGPNACGPASGAMAANFDRIVKGKPADVTALAFSEDMARRAGDPSRLDQIQATLATNEYNIASVYRRPANNDYPNATPPTVAEMRAHIQAGGIVIVLFERGLVPGTQDYYRYTRAHIAPLIGEGDNFFVMADPLATDAHGKQLKVSDAALWAAMAKSTWQNPDGTIGTNSGPQALFVEPPQVALPEEPPDDGGIASPWLSADEIQQAIDAMKQQRDGLSLQITIFEAALERARQ